MTSSIWVNLLATLCCANIAHCGNSKVVLKENLFRSTQILCPGGPTLEVLANVSVFKTHLKIWNR